MVLTLLLKTTINNFSISLVGLDQDRICVHCVYIYWSYPLIDPSGISFSYNDKIICFM